MKQAAENRSTITTLTLGLITFTIGACSSPPAYDYEHRDVERALWTRVSEERATQRVRQLEAIGPRMGGTESGDRAADYLVRQFSAYGLDVRIVEDSPHWSHAENSWQVSAENASGETLELARAWPYGFSPSSSGSAKLALSPSSDHALLAESLDRDSSSAEVPLLLVDGYTTEGGDYPRVLHLRARHEAKRPAFGVSSEEGVWLREHLEAGVTVSWELDAKIVEASPRTVVARIPAADPSSSGYFLFCAHGDSDAGGPGANDNGSGEAIVLEIASAWATALRAKSIAPPPRELRFAIWGSEIHSTDDYLERTLAGDQEILGVLNYDQSGFGSTQDLLYLEPDDLPANESLVRVMLEVLEQYAGTQGFPERWATVPSQGGTDSYVFSESSHFKKRKLPALTLFASAWDRAETLERTPDMPGESWNDGDEVHVDYDVYYHSAGDTAAHTTDLEPFNMGWSARVGLLGSLRWLSRL